jgi:hypothetical protein
VSGSPRRPRLLRLPGRRPSARALRPEQVQVTLRLPFVAELSGTWKPSQLESDAAWELYVELITRVTVVELRPGEGLLREALTSLYSLFDTTRQILRRYGPGVAPRNRPAGEITFGHLAVNVLNGALRPLLTRWHPALKAWEARRPEGVDQVKHERDWERYDELSAELARVRVALTDLAITLADVAGAAYLLPEARPEPPGSQPP